MKQFEDVLENKLLVQIISKCDLKKHTNIGPLVAPISSYNSNKNFPLHVNIQFKVNILFE